MPDSLRVCLGFPPFHASNYVERLTALDGIEPVVLPIDEGADWAIEHAGQPYPEPPPWAAGVASEREAALASWHVLTTLHTPDRLAERMPNLRWVQGCGAGVEQFGNAGLDLERHVLTNCTGVSAGSMSEWVIGRLLQVWKRFREADAHQRNHAFERTYGRTFAGSTIGIIGLGGIGKAVASRARALGCRTLGVKRSASRAALPTSHAARTPLCTLASEKSNASSQTGAPKLVGSLGSAEDRSTERTPNATRTVLQFSV